MSFDNKEAISPIPSTEFVLVLQYFCAAMNLQQRLEVRAHISQNMKQNAYIVNSSVPTVTRDMQQLAALLWENLQHICKIMKKNPNTKHFTTLILQVVDASPMVSTRTLVLKNNNVLESFPESKPENSTSHSICISPHLKAQR